MKYYEFKGFLQDGGWLATAFVGVDEKGQIVAISQKKPEGAVVEKVDGYAFPGFQNAHSHAFQYAMAGIAEKQAPQGITDDFWGWRELMYKLALSLDPDAVGAIAGMLYAEMARHGYTHVAEFHYLHHDKDGKPYANLAEMGERIAVAAQQAGIKLTLVPMFYQKGGFGMEPQPRQRRFISADTHDYFKLLEASESVVKNYSHARLGFGIHSLRAVTPADFKNCMDNAPDDLPFHIHISEQLKEVEEARTYLGQRPVAWLLDNAPISESFHLVHATHLLAHEVSGIAKSGAHVVLCPSTEGNLGDGLFPLEAFQKAGGKWSIGTDSHVGLSPFEELRLLDYGQRLTTHRRNTFLGMSYEQSGEFCYSMALDAGRAAMGEGKKGYFAIGDALDAVVVNDSSPLLSVSNAENLLSSIIYTCDTAMMLGTMVDGKWVVKNQQHMHGDALKAGFVKTMNALNIR